MLANKPVYFVSLTDCFIMLTIETSILVQKNNSFLDSLINYRDFRDAGPRAKVKVFFFLYD